MCAAYISNNFHVTDHQKKTSFSISYIFMEITAMFPLGTMGRYVDIFKQKIFYVTVILQRKHECNHSEVEETSQIQSDNISHA